jgi:CBS domain-containing protein
MVSEGDLIGRQSSDSNRRSWWLDMLEAGSHAGDKIATYLKAHGLRAKDVMSRDVVTVQPDESITRIAELLLARNIKRVPVVTSGQMIGVVSRADVLACISRMN